MGVFSFLRVQIMMSQSLLTSILFTLLFSSIIHGQVIEQPIIKPKRGISGKITFDPAFEKNQDVPAPIQYLQRLKTDARVRRHAGRPVSSILVAPQPFYLVVEGAEDRRSAQPATIEWDGESFNMQHVLVMRPQTITLQNVSKKSIRLIYETDIKTPLTIEAGKTTVLSVNEGLGLLSVQDMPWLMTFIRVFEKGLLIPIGSDGLLTQTDLSEGDYSIILLRGTEIISQQEWIMPPMTMSLLEVQIPESLKITFNRKNISIPTLTLPAETNEQPSTISNKPSQPLPPPQRSGDPQEQPPPSSP